MKATQIVLLVSVVAVIAASFCGGTYTVQSWYPADEYPVYTLVRSNSVMHGIPAGGTQLLPPVGAKCKLINGGTLFDCGKWQDLKAYK